MPLDSHQDGIPVEHLDNLPLIGPGGSGSGKEESEKGEEEDPLGEGDHVDATREVRSRESESKPIFRLLTPGFWILST